MKRIKNKVKPLYAGIALWVIGGIFIDLPVWILVILTVFLTKYIKKKWPASEDAILDEIEKREEEEKEAKRRSKHQAKLDEITRKQRERELKEAEEKADLEERYNRRKEEAKRKKEEAEEAEKVKKAEKEAKVNRRPRTGDPAIDKMLDEEELAIAELKRLDDAIPDETLSAQIVHLEDVTAKIVNCIVEKPEKKGEVRKFFTYYLPTIIKFLNAYDRMDSTGISGANIDGTKGNIESIMNTALAAFDKQLDSLYSDEALDISTDIKVMQNFLAQEGLTQDNVLLKK